MSTLRHSTVNKLLIRAVNWIGDAVMTTPALGAIRHHFPAAEITLLANPLVSQLFSPHDWVDKVITFDRNGVHRGITGRLRLAAELRKQAFDAVIILPNSFDSAVVPWLAGIPVRCGKSSDGRSLLLSERYNPGGSAPHCHEVEYYLHLIRHFGISAETGTLRLCCTEAENAWADQQLAAHGIPRDQFLLGINPGATYGSAKRWYPERFAHVAATLAEARNGAVVVFGGPGETGIARDIEERLGQTTCLNVAGATSVRQLMALIKRCNFMVTNDSGPMHIAAALGVPLAAIFGSTDHATTSPYTSKAVIVRKDITCAPCKLRECPTDHACMTAITPQDVVDASLNLLKQLGN